MQHKSGFTLVELLVAIAIIAILLSVSMVMYTQVNARGRDTTRLADLTSLQAAIFQVINESATPTADLCFNTTSPCSGSTYPLTASAKNTDGSGWVLVNFDSNTVINLPQLPVDPLNNATYYYTYSVSGDYWEVTAKLESITYSSKMADDGGDDPDRYEVGYKPKLVN